MPSSSQKLKPVLVMSVVLKLQNIYSNSHALPNSMIERLLLNVVFYHEQSTYNQVIVLFNFN